MINQPLSYPSPVSTYNFFAKCCPVRYDCFKTRFAKYFQSHDDINFCFFLLCIHPDLLDDLVVARFYKQFSGHWFVPTLLAYYIEFHRFYNQGLDIKCDNILMEVIDDYTRSCLFHYALPRIIFRKDLYHVVSLVSAIPTPFWHYVNMAWLCSYVLTSDLCPESKQRLLVLFATKTGSRDVSRYLTLLYDKHNIWI